MRVRPEAAADVDAIENLTRRAFTWDDGAAENAMIARFRAGPAYRADWSLVAEADGEIVGHVLVAPTVLEGDGDGPRDVLMLGPISVAPECQRRGIGGLLMRAVLGNLSASDAPMVVLWGHSDYYPRFGFRPAASVGLLPDEPAAMVYPLRPDLGAYAGLRLPH